MEIRRGVSGPILWREQEIRFRNRALSVVSIVIQTREREMDEEIQPFPASRIRDYLRLRYLLETSSPLPCFSQTCYSPEATTLPWNKVS